jgi:23S rRNA (uracil1939-C5)-methyltransferase
MKTGETLPLTIEKATAGGRMLARHEGQVVLVSGTIPGERVQARIDQVKGGVAFATTTAVEIASADRRQSSVDPACGGNAFSHIAYGRQLSLKHEIVRDGFARIAHLPVPKVISTHASPETGYRMRARLHAQRARLGFYRESSHTLCDPETTGQLLESTLEVVRAVAAALQSGRVTNAVSLDVTENVDASERAIVLELSAEQQGAGTWEPVLGIGGVTGATIVRRGQVIAGRGELRVRDVLPINAAGESTQLTLARQGGAFFQVNRHLLQPLISRVQSLLLDGPLIDLYAGSGLFGLAHAAAGRGPVTLVESDRRALEDLGVNARPFGTIVSVMGVPVEQFVGTGASLQASSIVVDPPRTGLARGTAAALTSSSARQVVYVSCDVATLARDAQALAQGGFELREMELFDLFPNTAHVETVSVFARD